MSIEKMSRLGFGLMRLPTVDNVSDGAIDIPRFSEMVDAYIKGGYNYFDTAYIYHGGASETAVKEALVKRYPRESFYLADKLPPWELKSLEDRDRVFNTQLERTGVEYFDFYLLHTIEDGSNYEAFVKYDCVAWGLQKKAEGKIKHFGFSFHGTPELLDKILTEHPEFEFVQIQLNYADLTSPVVQSGKLYEVLRKYDVKVIVMGPVKGGMLANTTPEITKMMTDVHPGSSIASWAIRFVGSLDGITTVLSGMSNMQQMEDNLNIFADFKPITTEELGILKKVVDAMATMPTIQCTNCRYCIDGCPEKILIPDIFLAVNTHRMYGQDIRPRLFYKGLSGGRAKDCTKCGKCEDVCPQHLKVSELMAEASELFDIDKKTE